MKKLTIIFMIALMPSLLLAPAGCQPDEIDVVEIIHIFKYEPDTPVPPGGWALVPSNPHPDYIQRVFSPDEKMQLGLRISDRIEEEVTFSGYAFLNEDTGVEVRIGSTDDLGPFDPGQKLLIDNPWPVPPVPGTYKLKIYLDNKVVASAIFEVSSEINSVQLPEGIGGWEQPRLLNEDEKAEVVEIALSNQRVSEWLQDRSDHRIGDVDWYAIGWRDGQQVGWSIVEPGSELSDVMTDLSQSVSYFPGVTIAVGEGTIYQMQIAVDPQTGEVVMVDGPYPSLSSPDRFSQTQEYSLEVMKAAYEEIIEELFDKRQLYDRISMTGYSSTDITLGFYSQADPEVVSLVQAMIDNKVPGIRLVVKENIPALTSKSPATTQMSRKQVIEIASRTLPPSIVDRAEISAELHVWYWEIIFDNLDAEADELMPWPLKGPPPPPPGEPIPEPYPGIWKSVIITVDAETGDLKSAGARQEPEPGPYVSREQAIESAREMMLQTPVEFGWGVEVTWFEDAPMEAYLRGDTWIILFWEDGTDNRFTVTVDAVTGAATGAGRG